MIFRVEFNSFRISFVIYVFTSLNRLSVSVVSTFVFVLLSFHLHICPLQKSFFTSLLSFWKQYQAVKGTTLRLTLPTLIVSKFSTMKR